MKDKKRGNKNGRKQEETAAQREAMAAAEASTASVAVTDPPAEKPVDLTAVKIAVGENRDRMVAVMGKEFPMSKLFRMPDRPPYARGGDWEGLARWYMGLAPHVPLAEAIATGKSYDLPVHFIPGTTVRFTVAGEDVMVEGAYAPTGQLPKDWIPFGQTPEWFQTALAEQQCFAEELEGDLTGWEKGAASALISGSLPKEPLRMGFRILRNERGIAPFGVALSATDGGGVKVERVFDPLHKFGVREGEIYPLGWFSQTHPHPLAHVLRTWAKMEAQCKLASENHRRPSAPKS